LPESPTTTLRPAQKLYAEAVRTEMSRYRVIIEKTATGFSAYSPDLSGCVATGSTRKEVEQEMRDAIEFHVEGLRLAGEEVSDAKLEERAKRADRNAFNKFMAGVPDVEPEEFDKLPKNSKTRK
jgi:predicted RNase H-like HicB family nuclease